MTRDVPPARRILGIGSIAVVMLLGILVVARIAAPPVGLPAETPPTTPRTTGAPIPAEARVFDLEAADLAVDPAAEPARRVQAPTLAEKRRLRAFPGAPPRVPHEVTADEERRPTCLACHARGGFAPRFGAYTPVTPHPEQASCLQCHVPDGDARLFARIDWRTTAWPAIPDPALEGGPPPIPHDLQMRERCVACHGGPAAVEEIRTTHPERGNCRQCHVPAVTEEEVFTRPLDAGRPSTGGDR